MGGKIRSCARSVGDELYWVKNGNPCWDSLLEHGVTIGAHRGKREGGGGEMWKTREKSTDDSTNVTQGMGEGAATITEKELTGAPKRGRHQKRCGAGAIKTMGSELPGRAKSEKLTQLK